MDRPAARVWAFRIARVVLVVALVTWIASVTDFYALGAALVSIPGWVFAAVAALGAVNTWVAAVRWRVVMRAFGAEPLPGVGVLARAFLVGYFYNVFVPGSVGGDVVRGVVSRRNFDTPAAGLVVVATERVLGLSALGVFFLAGVIFGPQLVSQETAMWAAGVLVGLGLLVLVAARVSGLLARLWAKLPRVHRIADLGLGFGISIVGHWVALCMYWVLATGLDIPLGFTDYLLVVPLSMVAAVLPVAVAGVGPREAAIVGMLGVLGVAQERALALSLGFWAVVATMALVGGLLQLVGRGLDLEEEAAPPG